MLFLFVSQLLLLLRWVLSGSYLSKKYDDILFFRTGLLSLDRSVLSSFVKKFQLVMHCLVIDCSPYFTVDLNGVNKQPSSELIVEISSLV